MAESLEAPLALIRPAAGHPMPVEDHVQDTKGTHDSEFRCGTFARSVWLPVTADDEHIQPGYGHGDPGNPRPSEGGR
jgi:hypothetical protein